MRSRPNRKDFVWTEWYPREGRGGPARDTGVTYRYRVQKRSAPVRTETIGPFAIGAIVNDFSTDASEGTTTLDATARFAITFQGKPIQLPLDSGRSGSAAGLARVDQVALLPVATPALLALITPEDDASYCALLVGGGDEARATRIADCNYAIQAEELTSDSARFQAMRTSKPPRGRVDRRTYAGSSMLLFHKSVLDVRTLAVHPYTVESSSSPVPSV